MRSDRLASAKFVCESDLENTESNAMVSTRRSFKVALLSASELRMVGSCCAADERDACDPATDSLQPLMASTVLSSDCVTLAI